MYCARLNGIWSPWFDTREEAVIWAESRKSHGAFYTIMIMKAG